MNLLQEVSSRMQEFNQCFALDSGGVLINTHCLYPGNGSVQVVVRGMGSGFQVSDDGGAVTEAINAGAAFDRKGSLAKYGGIASKYGLSFVNGVLSSPTLPLEAVPTAIVLVSNASKDIADLIFRTWRVKRDEDFRSAVRSLLRDEFHQTPREVQVFGNTNKKHKFENVIFLPGGVQAIVDPVLHDANSINSRIVANMDVRAKNDEAIQQRIVYDDSERWAPGDLNLLSITDVPVVPFSRASQALRSLLKAA